MNKKVILAGTGAAVIAALGFGSIALAQEDSPTAPVDQTGDTSTTGGGPVGELDEVPEGTTEDDGEVFRSEGGSVLATCTDEGPELVWWVAAEGFWVDDVEARPDDDDNDAEVEFENGTTEVDYDVVCVDGAPRADIDVEHDDDDDDRDDHDDDWDDDDGRDDDWDDDDRHDD